LQEENQISKVDANDTTNEETTTVGMYLKYIRLKQKKSIETVSDALCIRKVYIKAIEEDNIEELPPVPYGIGFVRSYAAYLGLNADRIVQFYKQQMVPQKEKTSTQTVVKTHTALTRPKKMHIYVGLGLIAAFYALWLLTSFIFDKKAPEGNTDEIEVIEVIPAAEDMAQEQISQSAEQVQDQITLSDEVYQEPEEVKQPTLTLKFKGSSWVEIKDADKTYLSGTKQKGFTFDIELKEGLELSLGKYYNVDTYLDGELTTIAGPKKQTKINLDTFLKH